MELEGGLPLQTSFFIICDYEFRIYITFEINT